MKRQKDFPHGGWRGKGTYEKSNSIPGITELGPAAVLVGGAVLIGQTLGVLPNNNNAADMKGHRGQKKKKGWW